MAHWLIQLIAENGDVQEQLSDELNVLPRLIVTDEVFSLLQYIDPCGDTVFNRLQMQDFLQDWTEVESKSNTPEEKASAAAVRRLAQICLSEPHLYLKFIGD